MFDQVLMFDKVLMYDVVIQIHFLSNLVSSRYLTYIKLRL